MCPRLARQAALVAAVLATLAVVVVTVARERSLTIYAHRGFASVAPENTVEAVRTAVSHADGVEVDVRRCGSGELVCVHDPDLERVSGVPDRVDETDWERLREHTVGNSTATIARLDDVLAAVPADVRIVVELKERGLAADVVESIDRHDVDAQVSSFDPGALAEVRDHDDSISLAYTFRTDPHGALDVATTVGCDAIHPRADLCLRTLLVPRAHRRGLAVVAWTVDSRIETLPLALAGVDGVFADRPPRGGRAER